MNKDVSEVMGGEGVYVQEFRMGFRKHVLNKWQLSELWGNMDIQVLRHLLNEWDVRWNKYKIMEEDG